jgi:GAF domain-containing protein
MASVSALALARIRARTASGLAAASSRQSEAFARLLQQVTAAANEALTFEEAAGACLAAICAHTGWPTAHVFVRSGDEMVSSGIWEVKEIARLREFTTLAASIRYRAGVGIVGRVLATGRPVWVEDATRERTYWRDLDDVQVRGAFAFPVPVAGEVAAVLEFFSREPVAPDLALLDLAGQIGVQLGRVIERERADDHIRFQAHLLESVGQAVIGSDANHRIVYWN